MHRTPLTGLYDGLAEFHDLFMREPWERLRPAVSRAFGHLGPDATILEVGAGTGMGTRVIAVESLARITAVEPSVAMRTALTCWVANEPALVERVTVVDGTAPSVIEEEDGVIDGFVCAHMLGHLDAEERARTFAALAARMSEEAQGLITVESPPDSDASAAPRQERRIGQYVYSAQYLPAVDGDAFVAEYQVAEHGRVIRRERFGDDWNHIATADLVVELSRAGLTFEHAGPHAGLVRKHA